MATRMQQRRGTAEQWTEANPILAAGEIGFETDTDQFKIGDGDNAWDDLPYYQSSAALGGTLDDYIPLTQRGVANGVASLDGSGNIPISQLGNIIDGAPGSLDTLNELAAAVGDNPEFFAGVTSLQGTVSNINDNVTALTTNLGSVTTTANNTATQLGTLQTNVGTISDTVDDLVANSAPLNSPEFTGTVSLPSDTSIGNVSATEIAYLDGVTSAIQGQIDSKLDESIASTTYAPLDAPSFTGTVSLPATTAIGTVSATELGHLSGVTSGIQDQLDDKAPIESPTFTGTVSGVTKAHVGLGNVDNTADADKPISDDTQAALDLKADLAGATFTGDVTVETNLVVDGNLTVNGTEFLASSTSIVIEDNMLQLAHENSANTVDLGLVVGYNDGSLKHSGIVRDVSDSKWKLFKGVATEPATTVDFASGSLDDLAVNNVEVSGVVFADGTQTKQGVPSITVISQKTDSYTLSNLNERDTIIEMNKSTAVTLTVPADSSVNYPVGTTLDVIQTGSGQVTVVGAGGVTINATPGLKLRTQWSTVTLLKRAANTWLAFGDLTA